MCTVIKVPYTACMSTPKSPTLSVRLESLPLTAFPRALATLNSPLVALLERRGEADMERRRAMPCCCAREGVPGWLEAL